MEHQSKRFNNGDDIVKEGTNTMENNTKLEGLFNDQFQPALPVNYVTVNVRVGVSDLFSEASTIYSMEAERVMRFTSNDHFTISSDKFLNYFKTLLFLRIARVNSAESQIVRAYIKDQRNYLIPAFVSTLINSIGKATDSDFGFLFVPTTTISADELLSPSEMVEISTKLKTLNKEGLVCVETGIAMTPYGELSMMATLNIQGDILSYRKDHPIYGFYASFLKHTITSDIMNPNALRIRYGAENDYRMYLQHIV